MVSRNPSEMARIEAMEDELVDLRQAMKRNIPKSEKESILRQIRELERQLKKDHIPYNSDKF